jgi:hypothetical protein
MNADGTIDERTSDAHDEAGHMPSQEQDIGADGTVHVRIGLTYDARGNLDTEETDMGADGLVEERPDPEVVPRRE